MPVRTIDVAEAMPKIFDQVQSTTANHQKNIVALHKLQLDSALHTESVQEGKSIKLTGERIFQDIFIDLLSRVLPLKKGTAVADRIIKFVGGYIKFINDKSTEDRQKLQLEDDEDSTASRFVSRLIKYLLKGSLAKDKNVRFRVMFCIAEMIAHLGEIDEELYTALKSVLLERVRDKEPPIRVQAVVALSKLSGSEDPSELDDGEPTIIEVLLDTLAYDAAAEVRRAALLNIPPTKQTLPALLARGRDVDITIRKLVYSAVLEPHCVSEDGDAEMGITHPRALTIAQRELVVQNGLGDREGGVRAAAGKLIGTWVDVVRVSMPKMEGEEIEAGTEGDVIALLSLFDLAENTVAEDALLSVFVTRPDILDSVEFGDKFWESLTPEKAFFARVFVDHCISTKDDARLEAALPVVTALAFRIQATYNDLLQQIQAEEEDRLLRGGMEEDEEDIEERIKKEEKRMDREFVLGEMLKLAVNLDYADEIGRRKMFQLVRDMISQDVLPESLLSRCLDVLRTLSPNERDLIRVVVEVVHELRDPSDDEDAIKPTQNDDTETNYSETPMTVRTVRGPPKAPAEMTPEERAHADDIDLRCLSLCIGMLERVNGTFEENSTLEGILGELIIPAVKRKELVLREKGLISLGLCCLIARRMALNSFQLFLGQVQSAPEVLKIRVLQIVFDILMVQENDFLAPGSVNSERIVDFLLHMLEQEESDKVQALLCIGIAKLMLSGMISDERVLKSLLVVYLSPETVHNQELRQCLSYFFPVFCFSSAVNQRRMQQIFVPLFEELSALHKDLEEDQVMVSPSQVGLMFVDWTDPHKAAAVLKGTRDAKDDTIHIDMAADIVKALFDLNMPKEDKKALCQLLGKLYIPDVVDDDKVRTLKLLTSSLQSRRPLRDAIATNAFIKFDNAVSKKFAKQLEGFNEEEYRQLEYLKDLFEFLDDIIPDDDEETELPREKAGRKRRSDSITTATTESGPGSGDDNSTTTSSRRTPKARGRSKRARISNSDESDDDHTERGNSPLASTTPARVMPRRSAAVKAGIAVTKAITPMKLPDDDDDDDDEPTPAPLKKLPLKSGKTKKAREAQLDDDIDNLLDGDTTHDSIMDSPLDEDDEGEDDEDEEGEVANIL